MKAMIALKLKPKRYSVFSWNMMKILRLQVVNQVLDEYDKLGYVTNERWDLGYEFALHYLFRKFSSFNHER